MGEVDAQPHFHAETLGVDDAASPTCSGISWQYTKKYKRVEPHNYNLESLNQHSLCDFPAFGCIHAYFF